MNFAFEVLPEHVNRMHNVCLGCTLLEAPVLQVNSICLASQALLFASFAQPDLIKMLPQTRDAFVPDNRRAVAEMLLL